MSHVEAVIKGMKRKEGYHFIKILYGSSMAWSELINEIIYALSPMCGRDRHIILRFLRDCDRRLKIVTLIFCIALCFMKGICVVEYMFLIVVFLAFEECLLVAQHHYNCSNCREIYEKDIKYIKELSKMMEEKAGCGGWIITEYNEDDDFIICHLEE